MTHGREVAACRCTQEAREFMGDPRRLTELVLAL